MLGFKTNRLLQTAQDRLFFIKQLLSAAKLDVAEIKGVVGVVAAVVGGVVAVVLVVVTDGVIVVVVGVAVLVLDD